MSPSGPRPLIGVSTYRQTSSWWAWERDAALVPGPYLDIVEDAGGQPVLLPPPGDGMPAPSAQSIARLADALDALVLIGGGDIDASRYGEDPDPRNGGTNQGRDDLEFGLLAEALGRDLPVLAVCRGLQVLNVVRGGTLVQQLAEALGNTDHQPRPGAFGSVRVTTEGGSTVRHLLGERMQVLCSHHQAVATVGRGLVVTARSEDGVVEALELPDRRFVVGVQWHPEETRDLRLFEALVAAAAAAAAADANRPGPEHGPSGSAGADAAAPTVPGPGLAAARGTAAVGAEEQR